VPSNSATILTPGEAADNCLTRCHRLQWGLDARTRTHSTVFESQSVNV
jgi:hypothetical protein